MMGIPILRSAPRCPSHPVSGHRGQTGSWLRRVWIRATGWSFRARELVDGCLSRPAEQDRGEGVGNLSNRFCRWELLLFLTWPDSIPDPTAPRSPCPG